MDESKKKYSVSVVRIGYGFADINIEANSMQEADC